MISCTSCALNSSFFLSSSSVWGDSTYLFLNNFSWIHAINYAEKSSNFSFVSRHDFKINHKVFSLLSVEQCKLIYVVSISKIIHFSRVLLQFKCFQQLIDWQTCEILYFCYFFILIWMPLAVNIKLLWFFVSAILWVLNS